MKKEAEYLQIGAAYIRVSTDDQTELSPDAQLRVIRDSAKEDGFFIPDEFVFIEKRGVSGRRADNREEFQRMIATAKSQTPAPFRRLYLWKFSRFARKPFIINESEYAVAEYIHQTYHSGADMRAIARSANDHGYRTKRGNLFDKRAIEGILKNKFYVGIVTWNGFTFQGPHECRTSITAIFEDNQTRMQREYKPLNRRETSSCLHWASGLLKCGYCGASLGYNKSKNTGRNPSFFQCWKYAKGIHGESCSITVSKVEKSILISLDMAVNDPHIKYEYIRQSVPDSDVSISKIESAISRLSIKESRIRDAYENGIDTLEEYRDNRGRLKKEREELNAQLKELKDGPARNAEDDRKALQSRIQNTLDLLKNPEVGYEVKGNALRGIVKKIVYDKEHGKLKCYYYIPI